MDYRIIRLGRDYPGRIKDFSEARNSFLNNGWIFFLDDDEEAPEMLLKHIEGLNPRYPYYWIRRVNLLNGKYMPAWNPDFKGALVSGKVRFEGRVHERVFPRNPHGRIDIPIVHNHVVKALADHAPYRNYWFQNLPVYRAWLGWKKIVEVARGR